MKEVRNFFAIISSIYLRRIQFIYLRSYNISLSITTRIVIVSWWRKKNLPVRHQTKNIIINHKRRPRPCTKVKVEATFDRSDLGSHRENMDDQADQRIDKYAAYHFLVKRASLKTLSGHWHDIHNEILFFIHYIYFCIICTLINCTVFVVNFNICNLRFIISIELVTNEHIRHSRAIYNFYRLSGMIIFLSTI